MRPELDAKSDHVFKQLFGSEANRPLLIDLLNAVLTPPPGKLIREVTLQNPFSEKDFAEDKISVFDVRARDQVGRQYNVEMQQYVLWVFPKRALYYWAEVHTSQLFEGDDYQLLLPTFSVCFLNQALFDDARYHRKFVVFDPAAGEQLCKDLEIHIIELSKFDVPAEAIRTPLERWCYFLKHSESLDSENLPATLDTPLIHQAMRVLIMLSRDEIERHRYLSQRRAEREAITLANAAKHALREGREEGLEEGLGKGELIGQIHLSQRLLRQALTPKEDLLRLSPEELTRLAAELTQKLLHTDNGAGKQPAE